MAAELLIMHSREEWLKKRTGYIGGSDASAVLGLNPYKSNIDLWMEKTVQTEPEDISDKPYVIYGTKAESHLRALFKLDFPEYRVKYRANNMWINPSYPWAHASLDGWLVDKNGRKGILEIKTTEILQSMQREKWNDKIPDNYYIQVLHYLAVTEFDFVILKAQLKTVFDKIPYLQTRHYFIERADVEDDIQYLMAAEKKFSECIKTRTKPALILPDL